MFVTRVCTVCDHNKFKIVPRGAQFEAKCSKCDNVRRVVKLEGKMVKTRCTQCNNETFKMREEENPDNMVIELKCAACGASAEYVFIDDEGNEVTQGQRTVLDIKKVTNKLSEKFEHIEEELGELNDRYSSLKFDREDTEALDDNLFSLNNQIRNLKISVNDLEWKVEDLESQMFK